MIFWLVDHVSIIYVLLALALIAAGVLFWQTKRGRELLAMGIIIAIGFLIWFLCGLVVTDRQQIRLNMDALAAATRDGLAEKITPLLAKDFKFGGLPREQIGDYVVARAKSAGIKSYLISSFEVEKFSRDKNQGRAETTFLLRLDHRDGSLPLRCWGIFVLEEGQWRLQSFAYSNPVVDSNTKFSPE